MFKEIITKALSLNKGETIELEATDFDDLERKRARLYRQKNDLKKAAPDLAESILITRDKINLKLTISRMTEDTVAIIKKADGSTEIITG
jgi:ribosomal protein L15